MLHIDGRAIALGAVVGVAAGAFALRSVRLELAKRESARPGQLTRFAWVLPAFGCAAGVLVAARFGWVACLPAYLCLVAVVPVLCGLDATARALPNRFVLPLYPVITAMLAWAAWKSGHGYGPLWGALIAAAVLYAAFLALALAAPPRSLGWGDVKLAGALGLFLGYAGWFSVWLGMAAAFALAAAYIAARGLLRHSPGQIPLGPALLVGTLVAVIVS